MGDIFNIISELFEALPVVGSIAGPIFESLAELFGYEATPDGSSEGSSKGSGSSS